MLFKKILSKLENASLTDPRFWETEWSLGLPGYPGYTCIMNLPWKSPWFFQYTEFTLKLPWNSTNTPRVVPVFPLSLPWNYTGGPVHFQGTLVASDIHSTLLHDITLEHGCMVWHHAHQIQWFCREPWKYPWYPELTLNLPFPQHWIYPGE
jgi:hypothetical protein